MTVRNDSLLLDIFDPYLIYKLLLDDIIDKYKKRAKILIFTLSILTN